MSTRSTINVKMTNADIKSIYCHFDGYPDHHVPILLNHYDSQVKAEELIALGDLSSLGESMEKPEGHDWKNPVDGYCVAYDRDRGEKDRDHEASTHRTLYECLQEYGQQYNYYWNGTEWLLEGEPLADIEHLFWKETEDA